MKILQSIFHWLLDSYVNDEIYGYHLTAELHDDKMNADNESIMGMFEDDTMWTKIHK